jgi:putative membrane protein
MRTYPLGLLVLAPIALAAAGASAANSHLSSADRTFVRDAAEGNMAEIADAQVAQGKSSAETTKQLAATIISDHTKANDELKRIADSKGVNLPSGPSLMQKGANARLSATPAASFDSSYANHEISDHEEDIKAFRKEASSGSDPDLKAYAQEQLPTLEHHLEMAKALKKG